MKKLLLILLLLTACATPKLQYVVNRVVIERVVSNKEYYDDAIMNYTVTYRMLDSNERYMESTFNKPGNVGDTLYIRTIKM